MDIIQDDYNNPWKDMLEEYFGDFMKKVIKKCLILQA